jgi:transcriptional regulator with XRE-family HTH domain
MVLFRRLLGDVLRRHRQRQSRTLRDVAGASRISLGYLSEIERGRKEASSELLGSLCTALGVSLADVLAEVSYDITRLERGALAPVGFTGSPAVAASPPAAIKTLVSATAGSDASVAPKGSAGHMAPVATLSVAAPRHRLPVVAA